MKKAFAYARVSTGEQAKGYSLEAQLDEIKRYCSERNISLVKMFSDSESGSKLTERLGLMDLLDNVDSIKPHIVIATESDRLSRNTMQFGWIDTHLSIKGVQLVLVNEKQADGPFDKAFMRIRAVFSEFETDLRQWRVDRGRKKAKESNRFMNRPPFGYRVDGKEIVLDKDNFQNVKNIFEAYCNNIPIKRIGRNSGKSPASIRYILSNRFYVNPELNGKHDIFIDEQVFFKVQDRLQRSREKSSPQVI